MTPLYAILFFLVLLLIGSFILGFKRGNKPLFHDFTNQAINGKNKDYRFFN